MPKRKSAKSVPARTKTAATKRASKTEKVVGLLKRDGGAALTGGGFAVEP
jgi:hypothetical protein